MSKEKAIVGSLSKLQAPTSVFDFIFSQPFREGSPIFQDAPARKEKEHCVPPIPSSKPIFVDSNNGKTATWQNVHDNACRLAAGLQKILAGEKEPYTNVSPVVLIHLPNCVDYASILFGVYAAGFTASLVNPALTATELEPILALARPSAIVTSSKGWNALGPVLAALAAVDDMHVTPRQRIFTFDPSAGVDIPIHTQHNTRSVHELFAFRVSDHHHIRLSKHDFTHRTALILWSSGTTGQSKGVCHSHSSLVHNTIALWHVNLHYEDSERWLGFVPFYHVFGLSVITQLAPTCGATVFVMPKFEPKQMLKLVEQKKITCLHLAPPVALLLAKSSMLEGVDTSSLKFALSGGAPLGKDVIEMVWRRLGIMVFMGYGSSEGSSITHQYATSWKELIPQMGNTGRPLWGVMLKIASTAIPGKIVGFGETGEIFVKSHFNMTGYLNNLEATAEVLDDDGWYHTGDVGKLNEAGELTITDRIKEMIKVKSFQVSPADLEAILCGSPHVADAAIVGVYDAQTLSEYPQAYVVPAKSDSVTQVASSEVPPGLLELAQHIKSWMEERTAWYKWLRGNIIFVDAIPKSPSGKILRRMLKEVKGTEVGIYSPATTERAKL